MNEDTRSNDEPNRPVTGAYARLRERLEQQPYETLAVVAGVGFILGGGLFTRFAARVIAASLRLGVAAAFAPLLDALISSGKGSAPRTNNGHSASAT
jgi:hypothetical protein